MLASLSISSKALKVYFILLSAMFINGYTMTMMFPFLPFMVQFLLPESKVQNNAIYAGVIASSLFMGRALSSVIWGAISDQKGRKPTLICSGLLVTLASVVCGFSPNFAMIVITRFAVGLVNCINGVSKAVLADNAAAGNINPAVGMSVVVCGHGLGFLIGPAVSGVIADPIKQYNLTISNAAIDHFLTRFPFSFPFLLNSALVLLFVAVILCLLEESLGMNFQKRGKPAKDELLQQSPIADANEELRAPNSCEDHVQKCVDTKVRASSMHRPESCVDKASSGFLNLESEPTTSNVTQPSTVHSNERDSLEPSDDGFVTIQSESHVVKLKRKPIQKFLGDIKSLICDLVPLLSLAAYGIYSFGVMAYDETYSVWAFTPPYLGGLGFSINQISLNLLVVGALLLPTVLLLYPSMERCFGSLNSFYLTSLPTVFLIVLLPSLHYIVSFQRMGLLWFLLCSVAFLLQLLINTAFCPLMIFINNSTTADKQGLINGLALCIVSLSRTIAPLISGAVFSLSLSDGARRAGFPLDFHLVFILFGAIFLSGICIVGCLPQQRK